MEIRWLGEVELTFDPLSTLPLSVYPWREDSQTIAHSVWAAVKLGIDLGGVFSKGPEQAKFFLK